MTHSNSRKKKYDAILTCNYSPWSRYCGGGQKSTHMLACALSDMGLAICVVFSRGPFEEISVPQVPYDIEWAPFFAIRPGISSVFRYLNGISFYRSIARISSPTTVLHCNGDEGSLLAHIPHKKKLVYTNRYPNFNSFLFDRDWQRASTWAAVTLREPRFTAMAMGIRSTDIITCTSRHSVSQVHHCFSIPRSRIRLVPNGLDPVFADAALPDFEDQRGILFYGRLTAAKGVDALMKAYILLPTEIKEKYPLTIIGQGPLEKPLQRMGRHQNVRFIRWSTGKPLVEEIQRASLVVLPSREESFGNTMIETLALGQRLLTSNCGSIPEVIGDFGVQLRSLNPSDIAADIQGLLCKKVDIAFQRHQQKAIRSQYSWAATAKRFSEIYQEAD
jgi:glycosyltransferase involved in cell wall biosynthesis